MDFQSILPYDLKDSKATDFPARSRITSDAREQGSQTVWNQEHVHVHAFLCLRNLATRTSIVGKIRKERTADPTSCDSANHYYKYHS